MKIYCVECKGTVEAELVKGEMIYPHRKDLCNKNFYQCPKCLNYVGCYDNTETPLGFIPSKELRNARVELHSKMDVLWKTGKIKRTQLYKELSAYMGYEYHNAKTTSIDECRKALSFIENLTNRS